MAHLNLSLSLLKSSDAHIQEFMNVRPKGLIDWEHVKRIHVNFSTDVLENFCFQHLVRFIVRTVSQHRIF